MKKITIKNNSTCPRCGASNFTGICSECGFPITMKIICK